MDKALEDCKNWRQHWQISISFFRKILVAVNAFAWSLFDVWDDILTSQNMILREHPTLGGQHPIWGGLVLVIRFLPGIEWHSSKESLKGQHRLGWFLSCLFFPLTIISSRVRKHIIFFKIESFILVPCHFCSRQCSTRAQPVDEWTKKSMGTRPYGFLISVHHVQNGVF